MAQKKNINQASKEDLLQSSDELGNELAERIVDFIQEKGGIKDIEELRSLSNIGEERVSHLKENFRVS